MRPHQDANRGAFEASVKKDHPMADHTDQMVSIAGCRIRLMRGGSGAPLLFLHGGGGIGIWLPAMAQLARKFDVIVPEHPGYGASDTPEWLDTIADLANYYLEFLEELDLTGITMMVQDWGGPIGLGLAGRRPDLFRGLVIGTVGVALAGLGPAAQAKLPYILFRRCRAFSRIASSSAKSSSRVRLSITKSNFAASRSSASAVAMRRAISSS